MGSGSSTSAGVEGGVVRGGAAGSHAPHVNPFDSQRFAKAVPNHSIRKGEGTIHTPTDVEL